MLSILLLFVVLFPALVGWGHVAGLIFRRKFSTIALQAAAGIMAAGLFFTGVAFFLPLTRPLELTVLLFGWYYFLKTKGYRPFFSLFWKNKMLMGLIVVLTALYSSFFPFIMDHFGYYIPTIKWLSSGGLVRGLANLDMVLGQMSVWHIFQAGVSHLADSFLRSNALLLLIYLIYCLEKKDWLPFVFVPVLVLFVQSPSPDLPALVLSLIIVRETLQGKTDSFLLTLSVFVFAVKATFFWLPLFLLLDLVRQRQLWNAKMIAPAGFVFLLYLFKNIWVFGFPLFPSTFSSFGVPWQPDLVLMQNSADLALEKSYDMQYRAEDVRRFTTMQSVTNWLLLPGIKGVIHCLFAVVLIILIWVAVATKTLKVRLLCIALLIKSLFILLFSAQYRFFIDVFFVTVLITAGKYARKNWVLGISSALSFSVLIILIQPTLLQKLVPSFRMGFFIGQFKVTQLLKPSVYEWSKFETYQLGNLSFNVSRGYPYSFDTQLPSITPDFLRENYEAGVFPQRDEKGFISRKLTPEEKRYLRKIMEAHQVYFPAK